jgi:hypothetical protein
MGREPFRGADHITFLGPQGVELTQSLLTSLLSKEIIRVRLVKLLLFFLQLGPILEHRGHLLSVHKVIGLAARERSATESKWILSANIQTINESSELILATNIGS